MKVLSFVRALAGAGAAVWAFAFAAATSARAEGVALLKINGEWHGVWQTTAPEKPVPAALQAICRHWTKLALPASKQQ